MNMGGSDSRRVPHGMHRLKRFSQILEGLVLHGYVFPFWKIFVVYQETLDPDPVQLAPNLIIVMLDLIYCISTQGEWTGAHWNEGSLNFIFFTSTPLYCRPNRAGGVRSKRSRYCSDRCWPPSPGFSSVNTAKLWQQTAIGSTTRRWEDKSARRPPRCFACSAWTWNRNSPFGEMTAHTVHQHAAWLVDPPPWPLPLKVSCQSLLSLQVLRVIHVFNWGWPKSTETMCVYICIFKFIFKVPYYPKIHFSSVFQQWCLRKVFVSFSFFSRRL